jgi:hypothetical protein
MRFVRILPLRACRLAILGSYPDSNNTRSISIRLKSLISAAACAVMLVAAGPSFADAASVRSMAEIIMNLNHMPSDADKMRLTAIAESTDSEAEAAIATAISNMKHKVADADKDGLNAIVADGSASYEVQELARILLTLNHHPSDEDKESLESISNGSDS